MALNSVLPFIGNKEYQFKRCSHGYPVIRQPKRGEPHLESDGGFCYGTEKVCSTWKLTGSIIRKYFILERII